MNDFLPWHSSEPAKTVSLPSIDSTPQIKPASNHPLSIKRRASLVAIGLLVVVGFAGGSGLFLAQFNTSTDNRSQASTGLQTNQPTSFITIGEPKSTGAQSGMEEEGTREFPLLLHYNPYLSTTWVTEVEVVITTATNSAQTEVSPGATGIGVQTKPGWTLTDYSSTTRQEKLDQSDQVITYADTSLKFTVKPSTLAQTKSFKELEVFEFASISSTDTNFLQDKNLLPQLQSQVIRGYAFTDPDKKPLILRQSPPRDRETTITPVSSSATIQLNPEPATPSTSVTNKTEFTQPELEIFIKQNPKLKEEYDQVVLAQYRSLLIREMQSSTSKPTSLALATHSIANLENSVSQTRQFELKTQAQLESWPILYQRYLPRLSGYFNREVTNQMTTLRTEYRRLSIAKSEAEIKQEAQALVVQKWLQNQGPAF